MSRLEMINNSELLSEKSITMNTITSRAMKIILILLFISTDDHLTISRKLELEILRLSVIIYYYETKNHNHEFRLIK